MLRIARERLGYMVQHYANLEVIKLGKPVCTENMVLVIDPTSTFLLTHERTKRTMPEWKRWGP